MRIRVFNVSVIAFMSVHAEFIGKRIVGQFLENHFKKKN